MLWLQSIDIGLFHFINGSLGNPVFDWLMPILSGHGVPWFIPLAVAAGLCALFFGSPRARLCALLLLLVVAIGDGLIVNSIKHGIERPRPCLALSGVVQRLGCTTSGSMPSAHAANWFAMTTVMFLFYRRSWRFMLPLAVGVSFSRVYCGVHYPSDVLTGAILGAGYALTLAWVLESAWQSAGRRWFPAWHARLPSLLNPPDATPTTTPAAAPAPEAEWLRLGYLVLGVLLLARWVYVASGFIGLSEDEAYQWLWSKHLALSYFSKPPGIAWLHYCGTSLFGDTELGVRFFSPLLAAATGVLLLRFMSREVGAQPAFWLLLVVTGTPLLNAGAILMTIDPPLVFCWTLAMVLGWRAVQPDGRTRDWLLTGVALGFGFLFKYTELFQIICWALFFAATPAARKHLARPGPWLALGIFLLFTTPVLLWNARHGWITVAHVASDADIHSEWHPTLRYFADFCAAQLLLLNPFFLVGALWTAVLVWQTRPRNPLCRYLFWMGTPVFVGYGLYSFHSHVLPNWIAVAVLPMFCLMVTSAREHRSRLRPFVTGGLVYGVLAAALLHDTDLAGKINGPLPGLVDPSHRVRGWAETALLVESEREALATNGAPAFIIASYYGLTGELSFYSPPAAKAAATSQPLVYCVDTGEPVNQFYYWDAYNYRAHRRGQNAIYADLLGGSPYEPGWFFHWLKHEPLRLRTQTDASAPPLLAARFESVRDLGVHVVYLRGEVFHRVHLWACYHLR
jgi:membrane-associated phospholipid phosphatase